MPTHRQSEASRRNGAKSHGPTSETGKSRSKMNGLKLGLRAKTLILPHEDKEAFESLQAGFIQRLKPAGEIEIALVNQLVATSWRLERFINIETHLLGIAILDSEEYIEEHFDIADADDRLAIAYRRACEHPSLIHLHRQINLLHRQFDRILQNLLKLRQSAIATSEPQEPLTANPINNIPKANPGHNRSTSPAPCRE